MSSARRFWRCSDWTASMLKQPHPLGWPIGNQDPSKRGLWKSMPKDDREKDKWAVGWIAFAVAIIIVAFVLLRRG